MKLILLFIFVSLSIQIIHHLHRHRLRSKNNRRPLTDSKMNIKMKNKHLKEFYNINDCKMQKYSKSSLSLKILNFNKKGERSNRYHLSKSSLFLSISILIKPRSTAETSTKRTAVSWRTKQEYIWSRYRNSNIRSLNMSYRSICSSSMVQ